MTLADISDFTPQVPQWYVLFSLTGMIRAARYAHTFTSSHTIMPGSATSILSRAAFHASTGHYWRQPNGCRLSWRPPLTLTPSSVIVVDSRITGPRLLITIPLLLAKPWHASFGFTISNAWLYIGIYLFSDILLLIVSDDNAIYIH